MEQSSVCVVDAEGSIVREATVANDLDALVAWFLDLGLRLFKIVWRLAGCHSGCMPAWLRAGFAIELLETRHVWDAFKAMPVKTDRKDAQGITLAEAARLVSAGALKIVAGAKGSCRTDGTQAGAGQA